MATARREPALIVGGGIGGLAMALALARIGRPSIIIERRADWSEAGAGIQLSPNGVKALERLGVADLIAPMTASPDEIVVRDARTARVLQRLPLGAWIAARHGAPYWVAHRRDLQAALLSRVAAEPLIATRLGFEARSYESDAGGVRLHGAMGETLGGELLIGADGVFSRVRQQLWTPKAPRFSGRTAARTVIKRPVVADEGMLSSHATGVWLGRGAHAVHYPVRGGRELAVVVVRRESWSERGWSAPLDDDQMQKVLRAFSPALAEAIGGGHDWRRWALFELEPLGRWSKGRVTLAGDAAHPTLPFLAQGGSLALEDAVTLGDCLAGADSAAQVAPALEAYDRERASRARRVVAAARRNDALFHLSGIAAAARNAAMRLIPGERVMAGYDWVYGWHSPVGDGDRAANRP